jgi:hypothetical protein
VTLARKGIIFRVKEGYSGTTVYETSVTKENCVNFIEIGYGVKKVRLFPLHESPAVSLFVWDLETMSIDTGLKYHHSLHAGREFDVGEEATPRNTCTQYPREISPCI